MIPLLLEDVYRHDPYYAGIRTVFTIHNLLYQGVFPYEVLVDLLESTAAILQRKAWNITET